MHATARKVHRANDVEALHSFIVSASLSLVSCALDVVLLALTLASFSSSSSPAASALRLVQLLIDTFAGAFNAKDASALGPLFTDDAQFVDIWGQRQQGRDAIVALHQRLFDQQGGMLAQSLLEVGEPDVGLLGSDLLLAYVPWQRVAMDGAVSALPSASGLFTIVLRQLDAYTLKCVALTNVEARKPPGPPQATAQQTEASK